MTPDTELLTQYATNKDETTFAELVHRHLDHVHSTALRLANGDAHLAEDVCQLVFADLARKAGNLADCHALSSWLHTSARFAAAKTHPRRTAPASTRTNHPRHAIQRLQHGAGLGPGAPHSGRNHCRTAGRRS